MDINIFEIFEALPGINCKNCGESNCMAFAEKLVNGKKTIAACAPLREDTYRLNGIKLKKLLDQAKNG